MKNYRPMCVINKKMTAVIVVLSFVMIFVFGFFCKQSVAAEFGSTDDAVSGPRTPENPLAENVLKYEDVVTKGTPYDAAGLLTYAVKDGGAVIMSCDPAIVGDLYIPDYIEGLPVTEINDYAFLYCANMTAVSLPETVRNIGDYAFCYCTGLSSVTMGGSADDGVVLGDHAFYRCRDLKQVTYGAIKEIGNYGFAFSGYAPESFRSGLRIIGDYAFEGCAVTDVTLPAELVSIGDFAYAECESLTHVTFPAGLTDDNTGGYIFYNCDELLDITPSDVWTRVPDGIFCDCEKADYSCAVPVGVTRIGDAAFYNNGTIPDNLSIADSVTEIGAYAFAHTELSSVDFPTNLKLIGDGAFSFTGLTTVNFPDSLEKIGSEAFYVCSLSGKLELGGNIKEVGSRAFKWQREITSVYIGRNVSVMGDNVFSGCTGLKNIVIENDNDCSGWGTGIFEDCTEITEFEIPDGWSVIPAGLLCNTGIVQIKIPEGITEIGENAFHGCKYLTDISLPASLRKIGGNAFSSSVFENIKIPSGLEEIGESAFADSSLRSVFLPDSVSIVGAHAFEKSEFLENVHLGSDLTDVGASAFSSCKALKEMVIPANVASIGEEAFRDCAALKKVTMNCTNLETIENKIFYGCSALESVNIPSSVKYIGNPSHYIQNGSTSNSFDADSFYNCSSLKSVVLPDGLKFIGAKTFYGCSSLTELIIPASVDAIATDAFAKTGLVSITYEDGIVFNPWQGNQIYTGSSELKYINIPDTWTELPDNFAAGAGGALEIKISSDVSRIGKNAFRDCTGLTNLKIPDSVTEIGDNAFRGSGLVSITIPDSVSEVNFGEYVLADCSSLTEINLPESWTSIPSGLLSNNGMLSNFVISDGIVKIGESAFAGSAITKIVIPDSVTEIADSAFQNCANLSAVTLPSNLKVLGAYAFDRCRALTEITIPDSLELISEFAFCDCDSLSMVEICGGVKTIDGCAFGYCDNLSEVVLPDSIENLCYSTFFGSNPGKLHLTVSEGSAGAKLAALLLYVNSDYNPAVLGMTFPDMDRDHDDFMVDMSAWSPDYKAVYQGFTYYICMESNADVSAVDWQKNYTDEAEAWIIAYDGFFQGTEINISDYVEGSTLPITKLEGNLFEGSDTIVSVTLGKNLKSIGNSLFADCANLRNVDMSETQITSITRDAFKNCTSLEEVKWPATLTQIGYSAFENCTALKETDFSGTKLTRISEYAFRGCSSLSSVTLREGFKWIDEESFVGTAIEDVYIPASQELIQPTAFDKDVTYHFTGDATTIKYYWINKETEETFYDFVLPLLLENNESRVAQFFGDGLGNQDSYFITTSEAGMDVPYGMQSGLAVYGEAGVPAGGQVEDSSAESSSSQSSAEAAADVPASDIEESDEAETESEEDEIRIYEVISNVLQNNPAVVGGLVAIIIALIVLGGYVRLRRMQ